VSNPVRAAVLVCPVPCLLEGKKYLMQLEERMGQFLSILSQPSSTRDLKFLGIGINVNPVNNNKRQTLPTPYIIL
jgi:hypothetical protein